MSGEEAEEVQAQLHERPVKTEGEELSPEPAREEIYQGPPSTSASSSSSGASSKGTHSEEDDDDSSKLQDQSPQNVSEDSAPPSTPASTSEMEADLPFSASTRTTQSWPDVTVEPPAETPAEAEAATGGPRPTNLVEADNNVSTRSRLPVNAPPHAPPPFIRNIYASELRPSPPPGIGALLKLHPPPHLANDLQQRPPGGSLAPAAGIPSTNASVAPRASGNFNPGSSNLPQPSTLPQLPGGNQLRGNFGSSSSSPSFQQYQLPQLSLSTDTMTQVSMPFGSGIVMPPPGFSAPLRTQHEVQFQGFMGQAAGPNTFSNPRGRATGPFQHLPNSSFQQGMGASSYSDIGSSSLSLQTNTRWPVEAPGNFTSGRQFEAGEPSSRPAKVQIMSWPDMIQPSPNLLLSRRNNNPSPAPASQMPRYIRNSLYDPSYEAMGLPIDPHLRLFLQSQNSGNRRA